MDVQRRVANKRSRNRSGKTPRKSKFYRNDKTDVLTENTANQVWIENSFGKNELKTEGTLFSSTVENCDNPPLPKKKKKRKRKKSLTVNCVLESRPSDVDFAVTPRRFGLQSTQRQQEKHSKPGSNQNVAGEVKTGRKSSTSRTRYCSSES